MREKNLREIEDMAALIREVATPGMSPKALIDAVRDRHPKATKKEVARAAFMSVIHSAEHDPKYTQELHGLAMATRDSLLSLSHQHQNTAFLNEEAGSSGRPEISIFGRKAPEADVEHRFRRSPRDCFLSAKAGVSPAPAKPRSL